jgi:hypothetical protein
MKTKACILFVGLLVFVLASCENSGPLSTEPTPAQPRYALAKATETPVSGTAWISNILNWGETWTTPSGTVHRKDMVLEITLAGDLQGTGTIEQHSDWTPGYKAGHVSGPLVANLEWQGRTGTFSAQVAGNVDDGLFTATFTAQGSGGFEGMKWHATLEGMLSEVFTYRGRILDPHGE